MSLFKTLGNTLKPEIIKDEVSKDREFYLDGVYYIIGDSELIAPKEKKTYDWQWISAVYNKGKKFNLV